MAYSGYMNFNGVEIANAARFEAYAKRSPWFHPVYGSEFLDAEGYTDPVTDSAPWFDADAPESAGFYGFYPVSVTGLDDGSGEVSFTESTREGGVPGRTRLTSKEVVWSGMVAGDSEAAVQYGITWMRRALLAALCSPLDARKQSAGVEMQFYATEPLTSLLATREDVLRGVRRTHRRTSVTRPPAVSALRRLGCGDYLGTVSFTTTSGDPAIYHDTERMFSGLFSPAGITWGNDFEPGSVLNGTWAEQLCSDPFWSPLFDPLSGLVANPPGAPNVPLGFWTPKPAGFTWQRSVVSLPGVNFASIVDMLPVFTLYNPSLEVIRDVRIRTYSDPDGDIDIDAEPCGFDNDVVVSYLPPGRLVIDWSYEQVHHTTPSGATRRADSLVFTTNQRPVAWRPFECGVGQVIAIDATSTTLPYLDLDLIPKVI